MRSIRRLARARLLASFASSTAASEELRIGCMINRGQRRVQLPPFSLKAQDRGVPGD
jgi:hypothetical protein